MDEETHRKFEPIVLILTYQNFIGLEAVRASLCVDRTMYRPSQSTNNLAKSKMETIQLIIILIITKVR